MQMLQGKISLHLLLPTHNLCTNEDALISKDSHTPDDFSYFIINSGASAHMCHDQSYYTSYQKLDHPKHIWIANDCTIDAVGISNIKIHTQLDGQSASGIIKGVLHLLELSVLLLSTAKLANAGVGTNTTPKHINLINIHTSRLMDCAYHFHNLYKLKVKIAHSNEAQLAWTHPPSKVSLALWHCQLSHISKDTIQKRVQANTITGIKVVGSRSEACSACHKGKQTQSMIPCATQDQATEVLR